MYFDVWIAQKITQNAENHIFEVLDFQIFRRRIDPPPPRRNVCDLRDMHRSEKSLDPRLGITSTTPNAASVFVLQNIVMFFVKSKQQIIREQGGLKPNKKSMAIRQQLKHSSRHTSKTNHTSKETFQIRSENLSNVNIANFMETLSTYSNSVQEKILGELTGRELSTNWNVA